jgi:hypothetical protein
MKLASSGQNDGNDNIKIIGINQMSHIVGGFGNDVIQALSMSNTIIIGDFAVIDNQNPSWTVLGPLPLSITTSPSSNYSAINDGNDIITVEAPTQEQLIAVNASVFGAAIIISGSGNDQVTVSGAVINHICGDDCLCKCDQICQTQMQIFCLI